MTEYSLQVMLIFLLLCSFLSIITPFPPHGRQDGAAPLWIAAQMGHSEVVKVLLLRGADRDAERNVCRRFSSYEYTKV